MSQRKRKEESVVEKGNRQRERGAEGLLKEFPLQIEVRGKKKENLRKVERGKGKVKKGKPKWKKTGERVIGTIGGHFLVGYRKQGKG